MSDSETQGELHRHIANRRRNLIIALAAIAVVASVVVPLLIATHVIEVVIEPTDAEAVVDRKQGALLTFGHRVVLYSLNGTITVAAEGFAPVEVSVSRDTPARTRPIRLEPSPGMVSLRVESHEEFLVRVDGRIIGTDPDLEVELAPGAHVVAVQGPRIELIEEIQVTGRGAKQTFSFAPAATPTAEFTVVAEPSLARILIDGVAVGSGSFSGSLTVGMHDLVVEADDYAPHQQQFNVAADAAITDIGTVTLSPLPASVAIKSTPVNATVLINGKYRGVTPLRTEIASGREHRLSVRKTGFRHAEDTLHPRPNDRMERFYDLTVTSYRARITANVPAEIAVNGRVLGTAPLTLDVTDKDEITAVADGLRAKPIRVSPSGGSTREYAFRLLTPAKFAYEAASAETTAPADIRLRRFPPASFDARESEDSPAKVIELSRPFYFAVHETTVAAFRNFSAEFAQGRNTKHPAVEVTWQDAAKFCNWLSDEAGLAPAYVFRGGFARLDPDSLGFRLPTEAEWEAVARYDFDGGRVRARPHAWGASPTIPRAFANVAGRELRAGGVPFLRDHVDNHTGVAPVGTYPANFNGIHDLAGNASEWVNDYYSAGPFAPATRKDPLGPHTGTDHVVKGANHLSANRAALAAGYRSFTPNKSETVGFRVARWIH